MIIISILSLLLSNAVTLRRDLFIILTLIAIKVTMYYIKVIIDCIKVIIYFIIEYIVNLFIINKGLGLHGGLLHIHIINITQIFHIFIYLISILILQLTSFFPIIIRRPKSFWLKNLKNIFSKFYSNKLGVHLKIIKYPLIILFVIAGTVFLISTKDLIFNFWLGINLLYTNLSKTSSLPKGLRILFVNISNLNNKGYY